MGESKVMIVLERGELEALVESAVRKAVGARASDEGFVSSAIVAAHFNVDESTVTKRWARDRGCPHAREGRIYRFKLSEVEAWMKGGQRGAA